jgi:hypothetical protein
MGMQLGNSQEDAARDTIPQETRRDRHHLIPLTFIELPE